MGRCNIFNSLTIPSTVTKNNICVDAINLLIKLEIREGYGVLDISSATTKNIIISKPNGNIINTIATFLTDGSDGMIYYKTVLGDLNQAGTYGIQAYIDMPSFTGYSIPTNFVVYDNL